MVDLKLRGYGKEYAYGVLPLDTTDFVCAHHLVCEERENGSLKVVMAYKTITLEKCGLHSLPFPLLGVVRGSNCPEEYGKAIQAVMSEFGQAKASLSYGGSWTIDPDVRKDRALTSLLRDLMTAMLVLYYGETGVSRFMALGALRFKTDRFFMNMGYEMLRWNGIELKPFTVPAYQDAQAVVLQASAFNPETVAFANRFRHLWADRISISGSSAQTKREAA